MSATPRPPRRPPPQRAAATAARGPARAARPASEPDRRRGLVPAAVLLFAIAALTIVRSLLPSDFVVDAWERGGAQFVAFYLLLLGVGLLQSDDNARRFVCFVALPLALLSLLIVVTGDSRDRPLGLALLALAAGLFVLLVGRSASPGRATAGAVLAALGAAAFFPAEIAYARAPREEARRRIAEWREADSSYARDDMGVRLAPAEGWVVLRRGSPFVPADASHVVELVHQPSDARAVIAVEPELHPGETLDAALDRVVEAWRLREPELVESGRSSVELGTLPASQVDVAWEADDKEWTGQAIVWQDASRSLHLAVWYESEKHAAALPALAGLTSALALRQPLRAKIAASAGVAASDMPQLTPQAIELLVARHPDADPPALFRELLAAVSIGFGGLDRATARDMGEINTALYGQMSAADAAWMEDYVRRVRAADATTPDENARAMRAMAAAVNRLPEPSRARLRTILAGAVTAALRG